MIEWLRKRAERLQSHRSTDSTAESAPMASDAARTEQSQAVTGLFRCPACDTVYVAIEMETCRDCHTELREVPSTLSGTR